MSRATILAILPQRRPPTLPASFLDEIYDRRTRDPLAPVTVVVPSHVAGIQLRRRLVERGPVAGVRFETLPRLAELIGASDLARGGRRPLARPIGDYLTAEVAREARTDLAGVRELPGFARVLRQTFRRLRSGGFRRAEEVPVGLDSGLLGEVVRLYGTFRARSSAFYDEEDLLDAAAAAVGRRRAALLEELGDIYVLPPGSLSAGSERLLAELRKAAGAAHYKPQPEPATAPETRFVLAPDPACEAREAVRVVIGALEAGAPLHEVAVFHSSDPAYRPLLAQAFAGAGVPLSAMPGTPLSETAAGRGVLMLAELRGQEYSRTRTLDWLSLSPLRPFLPTPSGVAGVLPAAWRRLAREAGITQGESRWQSGLDALIRDIDARLAGFEEEDTRRARNEDQRKRAGELRDVMAALAGRLEPLREWQPAAAFIERFKAIVEEYFDPKAAALQAVTGQIDQLGTIDAVGGKFSLESFAGALRANLEAAYHREGSLGDGVFVADYRLAAGMSFAHVVLCGAYEGVFPPGPPAEALVEDRVWQELRRGHAFVEDAELRSQRSREQALRGIAAATSQLTWTAPLQESGAGRDHYPSQLMLEAARAHDDTLASATDLRRAPNSVWLRKPASPTAALLAGRAVDLAEVRIRGAIVARREHRDFAGHAVEPALRLLRARHGARFGPYDGNLTATAGDALIPRGHVSPTSLEHYATCGFRYFLASVLRLRPPDEPEERDTMDAAERGTLVHEVLQGFFKERAAQGRPQPNEAWTERDRVDLLALLEEHMDRAQERGRTGLDVYAEHERRRLRADMSAFLESDTEFRLKTGAVPREFEGEIPEDAAAAIRMRGMVDRIDWSPDGRAAWVIDYKTGSTSAFENMKPEDPLAGGTKLQLPAYIAAARSAEEITPLYWFISTAGGFQQKEFAATPENLQRYEDTLGAILNGVRQGTFPAVSGEETTRPGRSGWENCLYCEFTRLCSRRRDDELFAKSDDPALRPWHRVGETARGGPP